MYLCGNNYLVITAAIGKELNVLLFLFCVLMKSFHRNAIILVLVYQKRGESKAFRYEVENENP